MRHFAGLPHQRRGGLQLITEEIKADRHVPTRRENVENAPAKRKFPRLADGIGSKISLSCQEITQPRRPGIVASRQGLRAGVEITGWRHPLQDRIHRCKQQPRVLHPRAASVCKPCQRFDPLPDQRALRRQTVIGKTVPGRKHPRVDFRSQPRHRIAHGDHAGIVPRHKHKPLASFQPGLTASIVTPSGTPQTEESRSIL